MTIEVALQNSIEKCALMKALFLAGPDLDQNALNALYDLSDDLQTALEAIKKVLPPELLNQELPSDQR